jgi:hypothetical protein
LDDAIRQCGFAVVDMRDDGKITYVVHKIGWGRKRQQRVPLCDTQGAIAKKARGTGQIPQPSALLHRLFDGRILPDFGA